MKTFALLLCFFIFNIMAAQNTPSSKSSATIQVGRTVNSDANIELVKTAIRDITTWLEKYEWELSESNKTTGVSPGGGRASNLNMSKSNRSASENLIYNSRMGLKELSISLDQFEKSETDNKRKALSELYKAQSGLNKTLEQLHKSIFEQGEYYTDKAAELNMKHEAVKSAINNIRS